MTYPQTWELHGRVNLPRRVLELGLFRIISSSILDLNQIRIYLFQVSYLFILWILWKLNDKIPSASRVKQEESRPVRLFDKWYTSILIMDKNSGFPSELSLSIWKDFIL